MALFYQTIWRVRKVTFFGHLIHDIGHIYTLKAFAFFYAITHKQKWHMRIVQVSCAVR